jgi:hypothetical protein
MRTMCLPPAAHRAFPRPLDVQRQPITVLASDSSLTLGQRAGAKPGGGRQTPPRALSSSGRQRARFPRPDSTTAGTTAAASNGRAGEFRPMTRLIRTRAWECCSRHLRATSGCSWCVARGRAALPRNSPSGLCSLSASLNGLAIGQTGSHRDVSSWHQCAAPPISQPVDTTRYGQGALPLTLSTGDAAGVPASLTKTGFVLGPERCAVDGGHPVRDRDRKRWAFGSGWGLLLGRWGPGAMVCVAERAGAGQRGRRAPGAVLF